MLVLKYIKMHTAFIKGTKLYFFLNIMRNIIYSVFIKTVLSLKKILKKNVVFEFIYS